MPKKMPLRFTDEDAARQHLEKLQWPAGPVCPHCGVIDRASAIKGGRKGLWFCNACRMQFTVTVGTIFERSKIPLHTWLYANHLLCSSKKGISSHQLSRMLGVTYKTAWFMSHRIREAMREGDLAPPMGSGGGVVEADETFIGTKEGKRKAKSGYGHKMVVMTLVERGGKARSFQIEHAGREAAERIIGENVSKEARLMTDSASYYRHGEFDIAEHETVNHDAGEYARYERDADGKEHVVHTNTSYR